MRRLSAVCCDNRFHGSQNRLGCTRRVMKNVKSASGKFIQKKKKLSVFDKNCGLRSVSNNRVEKQVEAYVLCKLQVTI